MYVQAISKKPVLLHRNELSGAVDSRKYERNERFEMENGVECGAIGAADAPRATRRPYANRIECESLETSARRARPTSARIARKIAENPCSVRRNSSTDPAVNLFAAIVKLSSDQCRRIANRSAWILALSVTPYQAANDINKRARHRRTGDEIMLDSPACNAD